MSRVSQAICLTLSLLPCLEEALPAQNPKDTGYQKSFFARREAWVDRLFAGATPARRRAALLPLQRALSPVIRDREVAATQRLEALAKAAGILSGLPIVLAAGASPVFVDEEEWKAFRLRFNFWLLALPAVVDPDRTKQDLQKVKDLHASLYPQLRHGPIRREDVRGGHLVHLTARAVLAYPKPSRLELRFRMANLQGTTLEWAKRGDANNPQGWRNFELTQPFSAKGMSGAFVGEVYVGFGGSWPGPKAPRLYARFDVRRGFFRQLWRLIDMRKTLIDAGPKRGVRPRDLASLDVYTAELMRVFLYGDTYVFRSWPLEALDEGSRLARRMLAGKKEVLPRRGDRVFGIPVKGGRSLPVRVLWDEPGDVGARRMAWIHFPPSTWTQDYAIDGLQLTQSQLLRQAHVVHVFLAKDGEEGYILGVQQLLKECFGIDPADCSVVGILDGTTRARFALASFKGKLRQLVLIAGIVPDAAMLANEKLTSIRVIPAYGLPKPSLLLRSKRLQAATGSTKRVVFDSEELRSLSQALMRL